MNYYISDLHFGHKNCLAFDNRPFKTIEEHDQTIINNWNNVVGIDDDVYLLGDISWYGSSKTLELFNQLNGNIHLIKGNHDDKILKNRDLQKRFVEIVDYKELQLEDGKGVVLCHYPIPCFKNHYYGWYHLFGHVHTGFEWNIMKNVKRQMEELYDTPCEMYNFVADSLFCEYAYVIDLDKNTFEVYEGFIKTPLSEEDRFCFLQERRRDETYYPVKLVKSYALNSLPSEEEFLNDFEEDEDEE